ncbi:hypothetical protein PIB30_028541 [Stylosanthes scabra]|uniref:CCHC-type domain-containing protein n=1 Tax=Stylosanthes scabra TaxID=79078 RepID=A0ABU6SBU2_9FABA|nr:hypothetical protein [Stylosanthes scabra]
MAAIRKKHEKPEDFTHKWLCMESIHAIVLDHHHVKTNVSVIKRLIRRPKVHARKRDAVEDLIEGHKLKKTFRVTCSKCGEKGHNFKTCKGAAANPKWKPKTRKNKRGASTSGTASEVQISQSAPPLEGEGGNDHNQASEINATEAPAILETEVLLLVPHHAIWNDWSISDGFRVVCVALLLGARPKQEDI